jgi:hypothetical protein
VAQPSAKKATARIITIPYERLRIVLSPFV